MAQGEPLCHSFFFGGRMEEPEKKKEFKIGADGAAPGWVGLVVFGILYLLFMLFLGAFGLMVWIFS